MPKSISRGSSQSGPGFAAHHPQEDTWYRIRFDGTEVSSPVVGEGQELTREDRANLAEFRFADQFIRRLRCELPEAQAHVAQLEVYTEGGFSQQPEGQGLLYVIEGLLGFWHGDSYTEVPTGGCIQFERNIRHRHANLRQDNLPTSILYVQIHK